MPQEPRSVSTVRPARRRQDGRRAEEAVVATPVEVEEEKMRDLPGCSRAVMLRCKRPRSKNNNIKRRRSQHLTNRLLNNNKTKAVIPNIHHHNKAIRRRDILPNKAVILNIHHNKATRLRAILHNKDILLRDTIPLRRDILPNKVIPNIRHLSKVTRRRATILHLSRDILLNKAVILNTRHLSRATRHNKAEFLLNNNDKAAMMLSGRARK